MRIAKLGALAGALLCLVAPAVASACLVTGNVVCAGTTDPVVGLLVTLGQDGTVKASATTGATGAFETTIYGGTYDLTYGGEADGTVTCSFTGQVITLPTFESSDASCSPPPPPPPPACDLTGLEEGPVVPCLDRPIGNPDDECSYFGGFVPVGDGFDIGAGGIVATTSAPFAIVKAGRACYAVTVGVEQGDLLVLPDTRNGVSHVTYCGCPPAP